MYVYHTLKRDRLNCSYCGEISFKMELKVSGTTFTFQLTNCITYILSLTPYTHTLTIYTLALNILTLNILTLNTLTLNTLTLNILTLNILTLNKYMLKNSRYAQTTKKIFNSNRGTKKNLKITSQYFQSFYE